VSSPERNSPAIPRLAGEPGRRRTAPTDGTGFARVDSPALSYTTNRR